MSSFLQFDLGDGGGDIISGTLRLWVVNGGAEGGQVYVTCVGWHEDELDYHSREVRLGAPVAEIGSVEAGQWAEVDVTAVLSASGLISFEIASEDTDLVKYSSKEGRHPPELVVTRGVAEGVDFVPEQRLDVSGQPSAVAVADVSGDGFADIVTVSQGTDEVTVLVGDGAGGFPSQQQHAVGHFPVAVAVVDVSSDGVPDIIVANQRSEDVSVLLGDGLGGFEAEQRHAVDHRATGLAVADASGNGVLDITTVGGPGAGSISVLPGDGTGAFADSTRLSAQAPRGVAVVDPSSTGSPTIAWISDRSGLLWERGLSRPGISGTRIADAGAVAPVPGEFTGDGLVDLAAAHPTIGVVSIARWLPGSGGGFRPEATISVGGMPVAVAVSDVSDDGSDDVVAAHDVEAGFVSVAVAQGGRDFSDPVDFQVGANPTGVALADVSGDGLPDIITANNGSGDLSVLFRR